MTRMLLIAASFAIVHPLQAQGNIGDKAAYKPISNASEVQAFKWEGISLETPVAKIESILLARGFERVESRQPGTQQYVKGGYEKGPIVRGRIAYFSLPGEMAVIVVVEDTAERRSLRVARLTPKKRKGPGSERVTVSLTDREDPIVATALDFKKLLCAGVKDEKNKARFCQPNTAARINFGPSRRLKLTDKLLLQSFTVLPTGATIHLERLKK